MNYMRFAGPVLYLIALSTIGCGGSEASSEQTPPNADASAEASPDAGNDVTVEAQSEASVEAGSETSAPELGVERWGGRIFGPIMGLQRTGRTLWIGTKGMPDPYGLTTRIRGGLGRLDIDTGEFRLFDAELPEVDYPMQGTGTVPTAGVAQDNDRTLVVAINGLLIGKQDTFTLQPLPDFASPSAVAVDREGGRSRVWVATDKGLMRLNADSLELEQLYAGAELGGFLQARYMALDRASGAVFVSVHDHASPASLVARVQDQTTVTIQPGEGSLPAGQVGEIVFDNQRGRAYIALAQWSAEAGGVLSWDGNVAESLVLEGPLAQSVSGKPGGAFGAARLAISEESDVLVVGGTLRSSMSGLSGGGIAWVNLETKQVSGLGWNDDPMPGQHVSALAYDHVTRRTYASVYRPCNETKLGNMGLIAISFGQEGAFRVERPVLSTVRSLAVSGPEVFAGVRDDNPGLGCDGYPIQSGMVRLRANRSGEMIPVTSVGPTEITSYSGPVSMDFQTPGRVALGYFRDGTLVGDPVNGYGFNQAGEYMVSLYTSDVSWLDPSHVWVTGPTSHHAGDPPQLFDVGPRGAVLLEVADDGSVLSSVHYVRKASSPKDVEGLPSSHVWAAVPAGDGTTYLVCGVEQLDNLELDRSDQPPFTGDGTVPERWGGIIRVLADGTLETVTTPEQTPDPRALAIEKSGALIVLDKIKGMLRVDKGTVQSLALPVPLADALVPRAIWAGNQGELAALYDTGAVLSLGGINRAFDKIGHAWTAVERAPGVLLIGTDEGLLRVSAPGAAIPTFEAPAPGELPTWEVEGDPNAQPDAGVEAGPEAGQTEAGSCIALNGICKSNPDGCCPGLVCGGNGPMPMCLNP